MEFDRNKVYTTATTSIPKLFVKSWRWRTRHLGLFASFCSSTAAAASAAVAEEREAHVIVSSISSLFKKSHTVLLNYYHSPMQVNNK
jgi:hypothetical protein